MFPISSAAGLHIIVLLVIMNYGIKKTNFVPVCISCFFHFVFKETSKSPSVTHMSAASVLLALVLTRCSHNVL